MMSTGCGSSFTASADAPLAGGTGAGDAGAVTAAPSGGDTSGGAGGSISSAGGGAVGLPMTAGSPSIGGYGGSSAGVAGSSAGQSGAMNAGSGGSAGSAPGSTGIAGGVTSAGTGGAPASTIGTLRIKWGYGPGPCQPGMITKFVVASQAFGAGPQYNCGATLPDGSSEIQTQDYAIEALPGDAIEIDATYSFPSGEGGLAWARATGAFLYKSQITTVEFTFPSKPSADQMFGAVVTEPIPN